MSTPSPNRSPVALGGLLAGLSVAFAMLSQMMPMLFGFVAALPLAMAVILLSPRDGILIAIVTAILEGVLLGPLVGIAFFCQYSLMGLVSGWLVKKGKSYASNFVATTLSQIVGMALLLFSQFALMGFKVTEFVNTHLQIEDELLANAESMGLYDSMAQTGSMSAGQAEILFQQVIHTLVQLMPSIYVVLFAALTGIHLYFLHWLCLRMGTTVNVPAPRLKKIIMPAWTLVPFLLAWVVLLLHNHFTSPLLWMLAVNVMVVGAAGMAVDGFSYIVVRIKFSEASFLWKMLYIMLAIFMSWYLIIFFALVGTFDCISDFRHLREQEKGV